MRTLSISVILIFSFGSLRSQVTDTLVPSALIIPAKYAQIYDTAQTVYLPKGFQCTLFYTQKEGWWPRMMALDPSNRVCVADMGNSQVVALADTDHDGVADYAIPIAYNDSGANSIAFFNGALYTAASTFVLKYEHPNAYGIYVDTSIFISNIPNLSEGADNHYTRTILFDPAGENIFLSVGSPCNACREKDTMRGSILRYSLDGSRRRLYATGLRNAVGITMDQATNSLWACVAERNNLGDNLPPEFATHIDDGGFYGFPIAYADRRWDNFQADSEYKAMLPVTHADTLLVNSMKVPDMLFDAHSTPLSLSFYYGQKLPSDYYGNIFITFHGSYPSADGRLIANGTKIMRAKQIAGYWFISDFATGFLTDSINYLRWARPTGILIDTAGDIYFSSDEVTPRTTPAIFKISYVGTNEVKNADLAESLLRVFPNPTNGIVTIENLPPDVRNISVVNILGEKVYSMENAVSTLDLSKLVPGTYYIRFSLANSVVTKKIIKN